MFKSILLDKKYGLTRSVQKDYLLQASLRASSRLPGKNWGCGWPEETWIWLICSVPAFKSMGHKTLSHHICFRIPPQTLFLPGPHHRSHQEVEVGFRTWKYWLATPPKSTFPTWRAELIESHHHPLAPERLEKFIIWLKMFLLHSIPRFPTSTVHTLIIINTNLITTLVIIVRYFDVAVCSVVQDDRSLRGSRRSIMSHHLKMESVDFKFEWCQTWATVRVWVVGRDIWRRESSSLVSSGHPVHSCEGFNVMATVYCKGANGPVWTQEYLSQWQRLFSLAPRCAAQGRSSYTPDRKNHLSNSQYRYKIFTFPPSCSSIIVNL